jgi:hypothetical protein
MIRKNLADPGTFQPSPQDRWPLQGNEVIFISVLSQVYLTNV